MEVNVRQRLIRSYSFQDVDARFRGCLSLGSTEYIEEYYTRKVEAGEETLQSASRKVGETKYRLGDSQGKQVQEIREYVRSHLKKPLVVVRDYVDPKNPNYVNSKPHYVTYIHRRLVNFAVRRGRQIIFETRPRYYRHRRRYYRVKLKNYSVKGGGIVKLYYGRKGGRAFTKKVIQAKSKKK